jgi:hypothetical protein
MKVPLKNKQLSRPTEITLHPKQFEAFDFKSQFGAAIAGVRGGKTYVGAVWAGNKMATDPANGLICAPDYKTLHDATLNTFFQIFPHYRKFYKQQRSLIELPDKTIFLRSLDDPLAAEGLTVGWVWGDEAGKYKLLAWHSLRSRVSLSRGQVFLTTTPYNMGWLYNDFYVPWKENKDKDLTVVTWASVANPNFPPDIFEAERHRLSAAEFKRRYEGIFSRMQGLVYNLGGHNIIDPKELRAEITLGGIDWGWTNPAALSVVKIYDGAYYVVDEWYQTEKTTGQIIEQAIKMQNKWGVNRWYADSANPEKIAESNINTGLNVLPYEKKKDSITHGVSYINQCILENRFYVFRGLINTLNEFEMYQYPEPDDNGLVKKDEPLPFNNHLMDAIRYQIMGFQPARRARPPKEGEYSQEAVRRLLGNEQTRRKNRGGEDFL